MRPFPAPVLSVMLFVGWLLLVGSVSARHVALAATLATAIPLWTERLRPDRVRIGAWGEAVRLAIIVLYDIVASALVVARQILGPEDRIRPGFVWVPLADPRSPRCRQPRQHHHDDARHAVGGPVRGPTSPARACASYGGFRRT